MMILETNIMTDGQNYYCNIFEVKIIINLYGRKTVKKINNKPLKKPLRKRFALFIHHLRMRGSHMCEKWKCTENKIQI